MTRKEFVKFLAAGAAAPLAGCYSAQMMPKARNAHLMLDKVFGPVGPKGAYHVFSKMFQFLDYDRCAETLAKAGATGIEWTVRKGGHVEPERVKTDLPKAVEAARRQGLASEMMVVSYQRADEPGAEVVFKTAADLGVKQFRPGYFDYAKGETASAAASRVASAFESYEKLGAATGLKSVHHNHNTVGGVVRFGALVWDMWSVMQRFDPKYVAFEFDPMRAIRETGASWRHAFEAVSSHVGAVCLKDFKLAPAEDPLKATEELVAAGQGVMPWGEVKAACDACGVAAPLVLHYEWPFPKDGDLVATVKTELDYFKGIFR